MRAVIAAWFVAVSLVSASLLARHLVALPTAVFGPTLATALAPFRPTGDAGSLAIVHFLFAECRCSQRVGEHLASKPRPANVAEHVVIIGHDDGLAARLASRGFTVRSIEQTELAAWGIEAAPLFVVLSPSGELRYVGGYTERKQALFPRDREVVAALRAGEQVTPLPVFGCAVSDELKRTINPLRLP